jgi:hypothetical protein
VVTTWPAGDARAWTLARGRLCCSGPRTAGCSAPGVGPGHLAASLGAAAAGLGAFLAMLDLVFGAFLAAGIADFGAELADALREFGAARHLTLGQGADVGATAIQLDAARHHLDVRFMETGRCAVLAFDGTGVAFVDAVLVFFVSHGGDVLSFVEDPRAKVARG